MNKSLKIFAYLNLIMLLSAFLRCSGLKYKIVDAGYNVSPGIQKDNTIYFLCNYIIKQPGREIIPMYMYIPGDVYLNKLYLYSYNTAHKKLIQLSELKSSIETKIDISNAEWLYDQNIAYVIYPADWDNKLKKINEEILKIDIEKGLLLELSESEKDAIHKSFEISKKPQQKYFIPKHEVLYYVDFLPFDSWQLPSPLQFCSLSKRDLKKIIVSGIGNSFF